MDNYNKAELLMDERFIRFKTSNNLFDKQDKIMNANLGDVICCDVDKQ